MVSLPMFRILIFSWSLNFFPSWGVKSKILKESSTGRVVSGSGTTKAEKATLVLLAVESLVVTTADLFTCPLKCRAVKISSTGALSPIASSVFFKGALVHPHPGLTLTIFKVSVPTFLIQNSWLTTQLSGIFPKSQVVSSICILGVPP